MKKRKNGRFIENDEYACLINLALLLHDCIFKSYIDVSRIAEEHEFTPELVSLTRAARKRLASDLFLTDMIKNILGGGEFFESRLVYFDIAEYIEEFVEKVNTVLASFSFSHFSVRAQISGERRMIFNEYKMKTLLLNLLDLSLEEVGSSKKVLYVKDFTGENGEGFRLSAVSERAFANTAKTEINNSADLKNLDGFALRRYCEFRILRRLASEMGGEFAAVPFSGSTKYVVSLPKDFETGEALSDFSPASTDFPTDEFEAFFGSRFSFAAAANSAYRAEKSNPRPDVSEEKIQILRDSY